MTTYNNSTNPLPAEFREVGSPFMVNTLLEIGYSPKETITLLRYAQDNNDYPDWSEASIDEIILHFARLEADYLYDWSEGELS